MEVCLPRRGARFIVSSRPISYKISLIRCIRHSRRTHMYWITYSMCLSIHTYVLMWNSKRPSEIYCTRLTILTSRYMIDILSISIDTHLSYIIILSYKVINGSLNAIVVYISSNNQSYLRYINLRFILTWHTSAPIHMAFKITIERIIWKFYRIYIKKYIIQGVWHKVYVIPKIYK